MSFTSSVHTSSEPFQQNRSEMLGLVEQLRALEQQAIDASNKRRATFVKRGQLTPNERLARLLDPGMPLLRLHTLANYLYEDDNPETSLPGGSIIAGIGFVSGVRSMIWVDDSGIRAGAMTQGGADASLSIQKMALNLKLPLIHLVESAGANLMGYRVEGWALGGMIFRNLARLSAAGIPTMVVLHGPSTAGGAYMPGMSDYVVGVKHNGLAALGGAALVQAATGEIADDRQLGGTEMHATVSGLVEYLAEDDAHGIDIMRKAVDRLGWNKGFTNPLRRPFAEPLYDPEELAGAIPIDYRVPYDVREILLRIVDGSEFEDFKPGYGVSTVCCRADIMGFSCGVIGNNGPIDPDGANKVTQFIQLCDQADLPMIFLNNTTGYMVGTKYEQAGMVKHGSKMIQAVANARMAKIALYVGASFGAGNYGMCGYGYEPDFLLTWPNARTGVMGGTQAARTMSQVARVRAERLGQELDTEQLQLQEQGIEAHFSKQESAFYTSGRVLDHGMIDPRDTRKCLGFALETCLEARGRNLRPNSFGVARV
ncbi:MAG: acyl-CoA carboxylase subunit beta [Gammaproteobacteria bacterium]